MTGSGGNLGQHLEIDRKILLGSYAQLDLHAFPHFSETPFDLAELRQRITAKKASLDAMVRQTLLLRVSNEFLRIPEDSPRIT